MKIAAYIAGDKNIVKSSIVVFKSLLKFHPEIDNYLFLSDLNIDELDKIEIEELNIQLKIINDDLFENSISWPKECFLNFKVPEILHDEGYDFALKLDNDVLINGNLDLEKNIPRENIFSLINHNYETLRDMVKRDFSFFEGEFRIIDWNKKIGMFGNVIINIKKYKSEKFWNKYKESYKIILERSPSRSADSFLADMGLFSLVLEKYNYLYNIMEEKYNYCASIRHLKNTNEFDLNPRFIHYPGPKKPWKPLGIKLITNPYYAFLREKWIDFVIGNTSFNWNLKREEKLRNRLEILIINSRLYKTYLVLFIKIKGKNLNDNKNI